MPDRYTVAKFPEPGMYIHFQRREENWVLRIDHVTSNRVTWCFVAQVSTIEQALLAGDWIRGHSGGRCGDNPSWEFFILTEIDDHTVTLLAKKKRKWRM